MAKEYRAVCCVCNKKFSQKRTLAQIAGLLEDGSCVCPYCGELLQTTYHPKSGTFTTVRFKEYMNKIKGESINAVQ